MQDTTSAEAIAREAGEAMWAADGASRALGMAIEEIGPGRAVIGLTVTPTMVNGLGFCHGGYIYMLADTGMAFAGNSHGPMMVAQTGSITYLQPGRLGDRIRATAVERSRQGRSALYDVTVARMAGGEVLAEFRGHMRLMDGSWVKTDDA